MKRPFFHLFLGGFIALTVSVFLGTGCQREIHDDNPNPPGGGINDNIMVTAGVRGTVIDENNQPVSGATVTSGANTTTTDRYGVFRFNNISLSKTNGYVKVTKQGYFPGMRTFITTAGRTHNVRIRLLPKTSAGNFSGTTGGTITISGGGKLVLPASAVTDASGNAYTGTVNVAMTWIDPTSPNLPDIIPGDLRGLTTNNEERGLETYGMLGVEMTSMSGQTLKIASGKTAELSFPIPASMAGAAPATIDLWNFDEATGRWKQEGQATKSGNYYIAQVSHFSFWNCDAPFPVIDLCMTLVNAANNQPLNNAQVRIKRPNGSYGYGWTDSTGNLCGKVPSNEALVLEVLGSGNCYTVAYSQNIGPFSSNTNLGTIAVTIPPANTLTITGTLVNCSNANVTNGAAVIYTTGSYSYSVPVNNGTFSFTIVRCSGGTLNFTVLGVDYSTMQQGNPVSGSGSTGTVNLGTIQACGTSSAQYVEFIIEGTPFAYASPPDYISTIDSVGNGTYSNNTSIYASRFGGGITINSGFTFYNNASPGTYPLTFCFVNTGGNNVSQQILTPSPTVNVTTFGPPVTGFVQGSFAIQMDFSGTPKNVICNFRARRN